jgi:HD-GYP domain-containing protein (c-di-GMP phosphodiesterase class II)
MRYLTIPKGSLDEGERQEIESHVTNTYRFLQQIPWTRELQHVPMIAYGHHEKLDGGGYPRRVTGEAIPIQTRMMTISDIYDALTAADRPYKAAVAPTRALDIMVDEVRAGQLDQELFRLFVDAKVFEANT